MRGVARGSVCRSGPVTARCVGRKGTCVAPQTSPSPLPRLIHPASGRKPRLRGRLLVRCGGLRGSFLARNKPLKSEGTFTPNPGNGMLTSKS
ncbi:anaphase-promoting complex subunit 13 isoform X1 [Rhinopithecus roxellana]|uniref:anaphase-promoting complex subunit 13 isoform X1 n=1 Tax=Rhinopithecus roxellana TaxID=61622 RepID=UPI0012374695|nr:anaphase-promoting complex subunit 13 isoform X1 [Rhinopithecus roxellana]